MSTNITQLEYPLNNRDEDYSRDLIVGSCNGIICLARDPLVVLWNPSIRKVKELPPFENPDICQHMTYGFGYDYVTDDYKVVAFLGYCGLRDSSTGDLVLKAEVKVNTLGTNFWRNIQDFPFDSLPDISSGGKFVSGAINWLASTSWNEGPYFIVSLDLGNESYQKILPPDYGEVHVIALSLGVLRDCLCMISGHDIWIMKEYGNQESWTKLFSVSYIRDPSKLYFLTKALYTFENGQVLLESWGGWYKKLNVYDPKIGTFRFIKFQNESVYDPGGWDFVDGPEICIESLISPCS
jgi:F-box interacting protein